MTLSGNVFCRRLSDGAVWLALAALPLALGGCSGKPNPTQSEPNSANSPQPARRVTLHEPRESWTALFIGGAKVGYAQTTEQTIEEDGRTLIETRRSERMSLRRAGQTTDTESFSRCVETPEGGLVRFRSESLVGTQPVVVTGEVAGDKLNIDIQSQGNKQQQTLPWNRSWGGLFAPERSLRNKPMKPGERRELKSLLVLDFPIVADVVLTAGEQEETQLLDETRSLLRVEMSTRIGAQEIKAVNWCDEEGEALKSQMQLAGLRLDSYETTREKALESSGDGEFDLFTAANVRVAQQLVRPHQTKRVVYRARLTDGDPSKVFVTSASQSVKPVDEHTADVTVVALRPGVESASAFRSPPPTDADLEPNSLIQSDNPKIAAMARSVAPEENDPWKTAVALERYVDSYIKDTTMSVAMATAAEVALTRKGDCTEHAMLLAALCRARGIPARVAVGLVYFPQGDAGGFAYHMWTEVWIDGRWIPIDATLGQGGIGAAHLTLAESNLKEGGSVEAFLPVLQVIGQLQLEILEQQ